MLKQPESKRAYKLSVEGLRALRAAAASNRPWESSTGPKTKAGKERSKMNALSHGRRSARARAARREFREAIQVLRAVFG